MSPHHPDYPFLEGVWERKKERKRVSASELGSLGSSTVSHSQAISNDNLFKALCKTNLYTGRILAALPVKIYFILFLKLVLFTGLGFCTDHVLATLKSPGFTYSSGSMERTERLQLAFIPWGACEWRRGSLAFTEYLVCLANDDINLGAKGIMHYSPCNQLLNLNRGGTIRFFQ